MKRTAVMLGFANPAQVRRYAWAVASTGTVEIRTIYPYIKVDPGVIEAYVDGSDALLLPGGFGVESLVAEETPVSPLNRIRDRLELGMLRRAERNGQRILAVCRGMELATVAHGGALERMAAPHRNVHTSIDVAPGSVLADLLPARRLRVYCNHRTCVGALPADFLGSAADGDGHLEAMENASRGILATQFHPERSDLLGVYRWLAG